MNKWDDRMRVIRAGIISVILSAALAAPISARAQAAEIVIDPADLAALAECSDVASCEAALLALIDKYAAIYPGLDIDAIAAAVAAEVAQAYNDGLLPSSVAGPILTAMSGLSGISPTLVAALVQAAAAVAREEALDLSAIASGQVSPA